MSRARNFGNVHGLPGLPQARVPLGPPPRRPAPTPPRVPAAPARSLPMPHPDPMAGRRIDMLEQRLNATEQSNRTLLDELMRVQQELKMNVKRNELSLGEEKEAVTRLDSAIRQTHGKTFEFEDRIRRLEDAIKDTRSAQQQMNSHVKSIEKAVSSAQQDQMERRSNSAQRIQEYKHEIMRVTQSKEQLERLCFSLRDELRETTAKVDNVTQELTSLENNVRMQGRLIEDSSKRMMQTPKVHAPLTITPLHIPAPAADDGRVSETVRLAMEGKLIQMNTTIQDLTQRLNLEAKKRDRVETEVNMRMNELLQDYGSTKVEKDKEMREFDEKMKELSAGLSASEKQRILMEVSSVAKDLSRKMDEKDAKLRDDTVNKLTVIESTLVKENKRRAQEEKALQEKVEAQLKEARMYGEHNADALKKHVDQHEERVGQRMTELGRGMAQLEAQMRDHVMEQERVLAAEITDRQNGMKVLDARVSDVDDRARMGLLELQGAVGMVDKKASKTKTQTPTQPQTDYSELQRMQTDNAEGIREQVAKDMARLDHRLSDVESQLKQNNDQIDHKLQSVKKEDQEASTIMGDKMQQKIDSVVFSHERLKKQVDKLQTEVQDTPKNLAILKEEVKEVDGRLTQKVDQERKERMDDVKDLRGEVDRIVGKDEANASTVPSLAQLNQEVDDTQTGMKKLAEAVHVVKSSLAERVKDEKKLREQEDSILRRDVERLNTKYTEMRDKLKTMTAVA
ncbi:early endosome antigen 1-like [Eriocheir sinensis]|uniref:early endosome antigen 1-like n=1 Tax=Eriocheir sinensis TaxID=95602 RepID=UPI0021C71BE8|nr:early endosome antigen 1-like [Eriocheir sinensis]